MNREDSKAILSLVKSVYKPSITERKIKAAYWQIVSEGPSRKHSIEAAAELLGEPSLLSKAQNAAFVNWFFNEKELAERLKSLAGLALDVVEEILVDQDGRNADRLKAVALVNDLVKATAPKVETKFADKFINDMSEDDIQKFLEDQGVRS